MIIAKKSLSYREMQCLYEVVLDAYDPRSTMLELTNCKILERIRLYCQNLANRQLCFFQAFIFLITDTTFETASAGGEGWHTEDSCDLVSGDCFNVWIPLFCRSSGSGIEVIEAEYNAELYRNFGNKTGPIQIITKPSLLVQFPQLFSDNGEDFVILQNAFHKGIALRSNDLVISKYHNPSAGDIVMFKQSEIHRGTHTDGIRIQLSLKFIGNDAKVISKHHLLHDLKPPLSKHGRLEASIVRTLLGSF